MNDIRRYLLVLVALLFIVSFAFAAQPGPGQEMSGQLKQRQMQESEADLRKEVKREEEAPEIAEKVPEGAAQLPPTEKVLIQKIDVTGVTLLPEKEIRAITTPFENKEMTLQDMQKVADLLTDDYRKKGYSTSRAYLPPQKIDKAILEIRMIEGRMGEVRVQGNYHFKAFLFKKKITLKKGATFNFNTLRRDLVKINQNPDTNARAVILPGKEPGTTDVLLEVKDQFPIHVNFDYDNYASRYLLKNFYRINATDNNLLGFEDVLNFQYNITEAETFNYWSFRYILPATDKLNLGAFGAHAKLRLGDDYKPLDIRGESNLLSFYGNYALYRGDEISTTLNLGFDYKDVFNFQGDNETSRDRVRVIRTGIDFDIPDSVGRTLVTNEIDIGLPGFMAGLEAKDPRSSRPGSGGEFVKYVLNALRYVKLPFSATFLWANQLQVTNKPLPSIEQIQLGGVANVRGYPNAELVGDLGFTTTVELAVPPYIIPQEVRIPFTKTTFYDAVRLAVFYDYGNVRLKKPLGSEKKNNQLSSVGCGVRFNLPKALSLKIDFAWALDRFPSDGSNERLWMQVVTNF